VDDGRTPRPRDLGDALLLFDEVQRDAAAAQVEQGEDEEGHVAHVDREVQKVDELLLRVHLQQIVGGVQHG